MRKIVRLSLVSDVIERIAHLHRSYRSRTVTTAAWPVVGHLPHSCPTYFEVSFVSYLLCGSNDILYLIRLPF